MNDEIKTEKKVEDGIVPRCLSALPLDIEDLLKLFVDESK